MIKHVALLIVLSLAYSGRSGETAAQELNHLDAGMGGVPAGMMQGMTGDVITPNSPFLSPPGANFNHNPYPHFPQNRFPFPYGLSSGSGYLPGSPRIVLPVPLPMGAMPGFSSIYGFQYPGSYLPRGTPLHRFNGYVVCNPPDLAAASTGGIPARRVVKVTATRSLAVPGSSQPCPVYTINGEIQNQTGYATKAVPLVGNPPSDLSGR